MSRPKPKILFVMHLPPPVHGAAMVGETIRRSRAVNDRFDCRYFNLATARDLGDIGKFRFSKIADVFGRIKEVCAMADEFRPDLVYMTPSSTGMPFYKDYLMARALKKRGYKLVYHYHNKGVATRSRRFPDSRLYREFFEGAKVILLSRMLYSDIESFVPANRVLICPNGIDFPQYDRSALPIPAVPQILFLSNLFRDKGIITLLDAAGILVKRGLPFRMVIAGAPTDEISDAEIRRIIASKGLADCTDYVGAVYGEAKTALLRQSDIFAFPTQNETFGLVLLEAMSHSLPCVASAEGGIPDIVSDGNTGIVLKENNADALADALTSLIADPALRRSMGAAGLARFRESLTVADFERNIIKALEQCV